MVEAHVRADHEAELVGRDFSEALEAGDLGGLAEFRQGFLALVVVVTVDGFLLIADAEEWGLENVEMSVADHFREELEEEAEQYHTAYVSKIAGSLPKDCILIANLSGRSDKDVEQASKYLL